MTVTASQGLRPAYQERQSADRCHAQAAVRRPISHHRLAAGHAEGQHHERRCERMQRCHAASTSGSNGKVMETEGFRWPEKKQVRSNAEVISILGLGTWRLKGRMDEAFAALAAQLEGAWRHHFNMELRLCHLPEDLKFADSLDPERTIGEYSYVELADPPEGERSAGWPRLLIENRAYCTRVFRKLHVELAARQDGLQVLHCVLYPRLEYDLPILSVDMVGSAATGRISLAIADPCPAAMDRSLPPAYAETVRQLQKKYGMESNRSIPEWGQAIFSDLCVIICPETADELRRFLLYTVALHKAHLLLSSNAQPVTQARESQRRLADIHSAHQRYCKNQQENSKTSAVLQAAFSSEFARRYMSEIMFDVESGAPDALSVA